MIRTVKVDFSAILQDAQLATGTLCVKLSRLGTVTDDQSGEQVIIPIAWQEKPLSNGAASIDLVPNALITPSNTYYQFQFKTKINPSKNCMVCVLSGVMYVPDEDCSVIDILVKPNYEESPDTASAYASQAKDSAAEARYYAQEAEEVVQSCQPKMCLATGTTTPRLIADRFADVLNVKDFGAVGDGVTDDTAAIQVALNSSRKTIYFPEGRYVVSELSHSGTAVPALTSNEDGRIFYGPGVITATDQVREMLQVHGDANDISLNVDGNGKIGNCIHLKGATNTVIHDCDIHDLYGFDNYQAIAIYAELTSDTNLYVYDNKIARLDALGNGSSGDGRGMCRAVYVHSDHENTHAVRITNNNIAEIYGEEGDCIALLASDQHGTYYGINADIGNNSIDKWSRRAIKLQCGGCVVHDNTMSNDITQEDIKPHWHALQGTISMYEGNNNAILNNSLLHCNIASNINVTISADDVTYKNVTIAGNRIVSNESTTAGVYCTGGGYYKLENVVISGNVGIFPNSTTRFIAVEKISNIEISKNTFLGNPSSTYNGIYLAFNCISLVMKDNTSFNGVRGWKNTNGSSVMKFAGNNYMSFNGTPLSPAEAEAYFNEDNDYVINLYSQTNKRTVFLNNTSPELYPGNRGARIAFKQNDSSVPNAVTAAIEYRAAGHFGQTEIVFGNNRVNTADGTEVDDKIKMDIWGRLLPISTDEGSPYPQALGTPDAYWDEAYITDIGPSGITINNVNRTLSTIITGIETKVPDAPAMDGTYLLKAIVSDGVPSYSWDTQA